MSELGGFGLAECAARRHRIKKIGDADGGSRGEPCGLYTDELAACKFHASSLGFFLCARLEQKPRNRSDGRHGFAAKSQGGDRKQIICGAQLARGVAFEGQLSDVVGHDMAVVNDADHALAAGFNLDENRFRAGVERVLEQLLHDGCRALDDFARGDAVGDGFREYANSAHCPLMAMPNWSSWSWSTVEGESAIRSWAAVVLAKAMTSRMDFSPARSMTTRSMPRAMPPW